MIKNGKMSKEERDFYREMIDNYVLKEHYERVKDEKLELQQRIDKAIEYIKEYGNLYCLKHTQFKKYKQYEELLEILGVENENK